MKYIKFLLVAILFWFPIVFGMGWSANILGIPDTETWLWILRLFAAVISICIAWIAIGATHAKSIAESAMAMISIISNLLLTVCIIFGIVAVVMIFVKDYKWVYEHFYYPFIAKSIGVCLITVVPLSLLLMVFRSTRVLGGIILYLLSFFFIFSLWFYSLIYAASSGIGWVIGGLLLSGIGVILTAIIAAAVWGQWTVAGEIILSVVLILVTRMFGMAIAAKQLATEEEQEGAPISSLSREDEVEIAPESERDKRALETAIFSLPVSINEVLNIGDKLLTGEIRNQNVVDYIEDEQGLIEEDEHKERILKLIARIKLYNDRNTGLRDELKSNTLRSEQRELLNAELEKNTKYIVTLCRKIRFNKKQIHRFISRMRDYAKEVEIPENVIAQYEEETGLTTTQKIEEDYEAHLEKGIACYKIGQYQNAIEDFNKAIVLKTDYGVYFNRGIAYNKLGQYQLAIENYDEAIRLEPDFAWAYGSRGIAYANLGQHQRAIEDYNEAIRLEHLYIEIEYPMVNDYYNRGCTYYALGQYQRAIADYNEAIRLEPDFAVAYNNRGLAYGKLGHKDEAINDYKTAAQLGNLNSQKYLMSKGISW